MSIPGVTTTCFDGKEYTFTLQLATNLTAAVDQCNSFDTGDGTSRPAFISSRDQMDFLFDFFDTNNVLSDLNDNEKEFFIGTHLYLYLIFFITNI